MPLATALIARLRSQFNHVFTLLIFMPGRFESINYYLNKPKIKLSLPKKDCKIFRVLSDLPPDPWDTTPARKLIFFAEDGEGKSIKKKKL